MLESECAHPWPPTAANSDNLTASMTSPRIAPDAASEQPAPPPRGGVLLAAGFGLGYLPLAPGAWGSLASVLLFIPLYYGLEGPTLQLAYFLLLVGLALGALWSTERALEHWKSADPRAIVIDEILGQWVTHAGLVAAMVLKLPATLAGPQWQYLLTGFILFRVFDVVKPFPIRRSERLPGAYGVVLDDVLAGFYAGAGLLVLVWTKWLT